MRIWGLVDRQTLWYKGLEKISKPISLYGVNPENPVEMPLNQSVKADAKVPFCNPRTGEVKLPDLNRVWISMNETVISRERAVELIKSSDLRICQAYFDFCGTIWTLGDPDTANVKGWKVSPIPVRILPKS